MAEPLPKRIYREDYRVPGFWIDAVELHFDLGEEETRVRSKLQIRRNTDVADADVPLVLHGEQLELREIRLDGRPLGPSEYALREDSLAVHRVPDRFALETLVAIRPQDNTELSGVYRSGGSFCTQCEAEGFRRITWYLDRPDVMATFTTTIEAESTRYPVLLSNGNRVAAGELPGGRHWVRFEDPFRKPCYLFALVAGDLRCHAGAFTTRSGRSVRLEIWVEPQNLDRCEHALGSLRKAMRWEEEVFGREYDLDVYMIVAVSDFNMGAMENKGLNIFNAKYVLARPDTASDDDYEAIEGVIAHEYFHNWTGNRITCRDWFQLTLKEGLTVFRDQLFTADSTSRAVKRISDVGKLRLAQFPEDAGPMAHPIRPESYIEMNNFYTPTVYEKGAEVVRMLHTLLGPQGFRRGMDLYFERHDGQAVTCDDFRAAMADANGVDLSQFERWYRQPGTPIVEAEGRHDPARATFELTLRQRRPETVVEFDFEPLHIPVAMGLLAPDGRELPLRLEGEQAAGAPAATTRVLELREGEQRFRFLGVREPPVPSLLRSFSAPVRLEMRRPRAELAFLMGRDADPVSRWEAGQALARELLLELAAELAAGRPLALDPLFVEAFRRVLLDPGLDGSLKALALSLPVERELGQAMAVVDVEGLHAAREFAIGKLARELRTDFERVHQASLSDEPYRIDHASIARRRLKNATLRYLTHAGDPESLARLTRQLEGADNMTDLQAALVLLAEHPGRAREAALETFYARFERDPLVVDKWFSVQAQAGAPDTVARVRALCGHPAFTLRNPNRVRSLLGAFATGNAFHFHAGDGAGYALVAGKVLELDPLNPQVAARLATSLSSWRRYDAGRQALMRQQLERIAGAERLSKDVYEVVERSLKS